MKLINKNDIVCVDGLLTDMRTDEILDVSDRLVYEVNEIFEIRDFNQFLLDNEDAILAAKKPVVYEPEKKKPARLVSGKTVATPLADAEKVKAEAIAAEWLTARTVEDVDQHLSRYRALALWFEQNYVTARVAEKKPAAFTDDIFDLTSADVIAIVEKFHDPKVAKLRSLVEIA